MDYVDYDTGPRHCGHDDHEGLCCQCGHYHGQDTECPPTQPSCGDYRCCRP